MRLALIGLADRERLPQASDCFLQAKKFWNFVVGLSFQLLRSLHCFIYATRHAWSFAAKTHSARVRAGVDTLPAGMPILHRHEGDFVVRVERPELAHLRSVLAQCLGPVWRVLRTRFAHSELCLMAKKVLQNMPRDLAILCEHIDCKRLLTEWRWL